MTTFGSILAQLFSSRPAPTGNPDVDELRLYNYLGQECDTCGAKPAHGHYGVYHCDACCLRQAREAVAHSEAAARTQGGSQGRGA
jgi:hypothetical protein